MSMPGATIDRICLTVPDLDEAEAFYRDALGFACVAQAVRCDPDRAALIGVAETILTASVMTLGTQHLELLAFDPPGRPYPDDSTSSDLWFQHCALVVGDMDRALAQARRFAIRPITQGGAQTLPPNTGRVTAFKFRDPFGHPLELLRFPPDVGAPVWHIAGDEAVLGIDHTAISVRDAASSALFYSDLLGFREMSRSTNTGEAQSHLDDLADDRVNVLALASNPSPPHLELLAYQIGPRRARPADWHPADIALTRTLVTVRDFSALIKRMDSLDLGVSPRHGTWDGVPAVAIEDPDGHALIVKASGF